MNSVILNLNMASKMLRQNKNQCHFLICCPKVTTSYVNCCNYIFNLNLWSLFHVDFISGPRVMPEFSIVLRDLTRYLNMKKDPALILINIFELNQVSNLKFAMVFCNEYLAKFQKFSKTLSYLEKP